MQLGRYSLPSRISKIKRYWIVQKTQFGRSAKVNGRDIKNWTIHIFDESRLYFEGYFKDRPLSLLWNSYFGWTRTLFQKMVIFSNFRKMSMSSDSALNITPMVKFWVTCVLSVGRYRRKLVTDIDQLVYGKTPSKSKIFQNWRFLRILHGIWLDGVFFLPIILIHTRIISVLKL